MSHLLVWLSKLNLTHKLPAGKEADWHVTLMYDRSNPELTVPGVRTSQEYYLAAKPASVEVMGNNQWRSLVLRLNSENLEDRHSQLKAVGFNHSYSEFKPHLSLWLEPDDDPETVKILNDNIHLLTESLPYGTMWFGNEQWRPITE